MLSAPRSPWQRAYIPTSSRSPALIDSPEGVRGGAAGVSGTNLANLTGFPDLIVPAGFTGKASVGLSFFGPALSEKKILSLGYSFERATNARCRPVNTPPLKGESIWLP
jgi:amidase